MGEKPGREWREGILYLSSSGGLNRRRTEGWVEQKQRARSPMGTGMGEGIRMKNENALASRGAVLARRWCITCR